LKKLFARQSTLVLDENENSKLVQKLRQWKVMKKEYENTQFQKKVSTTGVALNDNQYKLMIMKLMKVERLIKDLDKGSKNVDGRVDQIIRDNNIDSQRDSSQTSRMGGASRAGTRRMSQMSGRMGTQFGRKHSQF
jgi:predicted phage-related endonuclease